MGWCIKGRVSEKLALVTLYPQSGTLELPDGSYLDPPAYFPFGFGISLARTLMRATEKALHCNVYRYTTLTTLRSEPQTRNPEPPHP